MDFSNFLKRDDVQQHREHFLGVLQERTRPGRHGDLDDWLQTLERLPDALPSKTKLNQDLITIGAEDDLSEQQQSDLDAALRALSPWRKGPYQIFGSMIDTEWRSDWKWQRLAPHIHALEGRKVLDVGCGTGYHCWRMLGAKAEWVLGIDPSMRFLVQYMAVQKYLRNNHFDFLPIGIEDMPGNMPIFDSIFSMGVIYHRRNPINHLLELKNLLTKGGELVLETLIVDSDTERLSEGILRPHDRYAKMRNVWSIMTEEKIISLLGEAGFKNARCVDTNITSIKEQRSTPWMTFHSLQQFLDPNDHGKTIEGYPAPKRGIFLANNP